MMQDKRKTTENKEQNKRWINFLLIRVSLTNNGLWQSPTTEGKRNHTSKREILYLGKLEKS
jgi:hypothetical protein